MKKLLFTIFYSVLLFLSQTANAQSIFISTSTELHKTYLGSCNSTLVGSFAPVTGMLDLAFNPNGNLYGITANDFYQIDTLTGAATYLGTHGTGVTALTSDNNGNIYAATSSGNFYSLNPTNGAPLLLGVMATGAAGDLAFFDGNLYLADVTGELFRVDPLNPAGGASIGIMNLGSGGLPYGLISTGTTCQVTQFLAGGNGSLFTVNPNNAQTTLVCNLGLSITGLSSPNDYLASDCTLQIDLDFNDNSGALDHDFFGDTVCTASVDVVDSDVFVYAPNTIDSITISISGGVLDGANEILTLAAAGNLTINGSGTANITLVNNGTADYYNYQDALLAMQYQNTSSIPSFGQRQITFLAYSGTDVSTVSTTSFYLLSQDNLQLDLGNDSTLCLGNTLTLDAISPSAIDYLWNDNSTNPQLTVSQSGTYIATISNFCGALSDTINVIFEPLPTVDLGNDTIICAGETLTLDATHPLATVYNWQNSSTNPVLSVNQTGLYIVEVGSSCGQDVDSIDVFVYTSNLSLDLGLDTLFCSGDTILLDATTPFASTYSWNNGSSDPTLNVTQGGTYIVTVTDICNFTITDTIVFTNFVSQLNVDLGNDTVLCSGDLKLLDVTQPTVISYTWQDGTDNSSFPVTTEGLYSVVLTDLCGAVSDSIYVDYILPPTLELGEDTIVCNGRAVVLTAYDPNVDSYTWQDGSTLSSFIATTRGTYRVISSNACATIEDSIKISYADDALYFPFPKDRFICDGDTVWLGTLDDNVTYEWNTGSTEQVIQVWEYGTYSATISNGCIDIVETIEVQPSDACCPVFMPDAFSPNNDSYNDGYQAFTACPLNDFELVIFDRWGTVLFRSTDQNQAWDGTYNGKALSPGVFIWKVVYNDGKFDHSESGSLTLVR